jgi:hypothetical protein
MFAAQRQPSYKSHKRIAAIDPNLPAGLLQSCPTLGQSSFGFRVYKAAALGHRERLRVATGIETPKLDG